MNDRLRVGGVMSLGALALAFATAGGRAAEPAARNPAVKPSTERTLRLPEKPHRYSPISSTILPRVCRLATRASASRA